MPVVSELTDSRHQAWSWRYRREGNETIWAVVHCMQASETLTRAEDLGKNWFGTKEAGTASTHYGIDANSVVNYVWEEHAAYGAGGGSNDKGVHVEFSGFAEQSQDEWLDPFGIVQFDVAGRLYADICRRYNLPVDWLDADKLTQNPNRPGITSHVEINKAFHGGAGHWDPGPGFPVSYFLASVHNWLLTPNTKRPALARGQRDGWASHGRGRGLIGDLSGYVSAAQRLLISHGLDLGKWGPAGDGVDGIFGEDMANAVKKFTDSDNEYITKEVWRDLEKGKTIVIPIPVKPSKPSKEVSNLIRVIEVNLENARVSIEKLKKEL